MRYKHISPIRALPLALLVGCAAAPLRTQAPAPSPSTAQAAPEKPDFDASALGVVTTPAPGMPCFSGRHLDSGVEILVFEDEELPVMRLTATGEACPDEPDGRKVDAALWHRTRLEGEGGQVAVLAIGVANSADNVEVDEDGSVDLNGDGSKERFGACASSEGVHLTVWSEASHPSKRLWHSYVYLGYDTTPTCSDDETAP